MVSRKVLGFGITYYANNRGYIGIMEKKMETIGIMEFYMGYIGILRGYIGVILG